MTGVQIQIRFSQLIIKMNFFFVLDRYLDLLAKIKEPLHEICRPLVEGRQSEADKTMISLMMECWSEFSADRPSFDDIARTILFMNKGRYVIYNDEGAKGLCTV